MTGIVVRLRTDKTVQYDNVEHGAGYLASGEPNNRQWGIDTSHLDTMLSVKDRASFEGALRKHLERYSLDLAGFCIFDPGRLTSNMYEDNDGNSLDGKDCRRLHEQGEQIYLCNYNLHLEVLPEETEPTVEELKELLPSLEIYG
jgi:hypothetical protein